METIQSRWRLWKWRKAPITEFTAQILHLKDDSIPLKIDWHFGIMHSFAVLLKIRQEDQYHITATARSRAANFWSWNLFGKTLIAINPNTMTFKIHQIRPLDTYQVYIKNPNVITIIHFTHILFKFTYYNKVSHINESEFLIKKLWPAICPRPLLGKQMT